MGLIRRYRERRAIRRDVKRQMRLLAQVFDVLLSEKPL